MEREWKIRKEYFLVKLFLQTVVTIIDTKVSVED